MLRVGLLQKTKGFRLPSVHMVFVTPSRNSKVGRPRLKGSRVVTVGASIVVVCVIGEVEAGYEDCQISCSSNAAGRDLTVATLPWDDRKIRDPSMRMVGRDLRLWKQPYSLCIDQIPVRTFFIGIPQWYPP